MTPAQGISCAALAGLAACAPQAAAPVGTPASLKIVEQGGLMIVTGAMAKGGADAHFHCAAGRYARRAGASEIDWLEGVVQMRGSRPESAEYRYFIPTGGDLPPGVVDKVIGGPEPVENFLFDCSGFPPEASS